MLETHVNTKSLLSKIRSGKEGRDAVIKNLFNDSKLRSKVMSIILSYGGQRSDFDHVFSVTLMQFVKTVVKKKDMDITASLNSYIAGIAKYVWYNELKSKKKNLSEDIEEQLDIQSDDTPETLILRQSSATLLDELLQKLGKNCKAVLMYWANGYTMKEIAPMVGYKSDMMAKKKKYKCFKELLDYLEENPEIKNVLR